MRDRSTEAAANDALETDRHCYNQAFGELGLAWYWDARTYADLQLIPEHRRVRSYVESHVPHLLSAYDPEFLVDAIEFKRSELHGARIA